MIYSYDKAAQIPLMDLYDTQMILASVNAARDMYEKGLQQMKDFRDKYGDLMFSDPSAQQWYNNEFNIPGFVNSLYEQGIDPVRSSEGRARLNQYINSRNYGGLNNLRQWDANKKLYDESAAKAGENYDPEFEAWRLGYDPRTFRMVNPDGTMNPFLATSVTPYTNLHDLVHPTFSAIKPHLLNADQVKSRGYEYDPRYDYEGVTEDDMRKAMEEYMPGVRNNTSYMYQRYLAKQDLIREGNSDPTESQIDKKLVDNAITADAGIMTPLTRDKNIYGDDWLDQRNTGRDLWKEKQLRANHPGYDSNGDYIGDSEETDGEFNWDARVYNSGLNNAVNAAPGEVSYKGLESGEAWRIYRNKVVGTHANGAAVLEPFIHQRGMDLSTLTDYFRRNAVNKGVDEDVDLSGKKFINATSGDFDNIISANDLGAAVKWSAGIIGRHPGESMDDAYNRIPKMYEAHKLSNYKDTFTAAGTTGQIKKNPKDYTFAVDTSQDNGIVTVFVAGRWRSYAPITLQRRDNAGAEERGYYYELPAKSVMNNGTPREFRLYGTNTVWDPQFDLGRMPGNENMSKVVRAKPRGDVSTATDKGY